MYGATNRIGVSDKAYKNCALFSNNDSKLKTCKETLLAQISYTMSYYNLDNVEEKEKTISLLFSTIIRKEIYNKYFLKIMEVDHVLFVHSANMAIIAAVLSLKLNYSITIIEDIMAGCLLHDLGRVLPNENDLDPEYLGYNELYKDKNIPFIVSDLVLNQHQKEPVSVVYGKEEYIKIFQISEMFEIYVMRKPNNSTKKLKFYTYLDEYLKANLTPSGKYLVKTFSPFHIGELVETKKYGQVMVIKHTKNILAPVIKILSNGRSINMSYSIFKNNNLCEI